MAKRKWRAFTKEFKAETGGSSGTAGSPSGRSRGSSISRRPRSGTGCARPRSMPSQDLQALRSQGLQARRSANFKKVSLLVSDAEMACKAGESGVAADKAAAP
jgi:hypothetical protein